jgi:hypothetical protein
MPTSLGTFKTNLYGPLGGRNDSEVQAFITRGVNFACTLIALLYDPPELQSSSSATINAGSTTTSIAAYTRVANITNVTNTSNSDSKIWMLPCDMLGLWAPLEAAAAKYFKYYGRDGMTLHFRPLSTFENIVSVEYNQYPLVVSADGDEISFSNYDPLVEAYALAFVQACLEESDMAGVWKTLGDAIGAPQQIMLKTRQYLEGGPAHGNDTSGTKT